MRDAFELLEDLEVEERGVQKRLAQASTTGGLVGCPCPGDWENCRLTLEALHPPTIQGLPLGAVLAQADPADYPDLMDGAMLEAFAHSLVATGYLDPTQYPDALPKSTAAPERPLVRCGDCQHFQPDAIGDGSGIGRCGAGRKPHYPEVPCYPRVERICADWRTKP